MVIPPKASHKRFVEAAKCAGVPRDQLTNFLRLGCIMQPRQLAASAAARRCDAPDGPTELGYGGARGGGKSHWLLGQLAEDCLRYPGLKCLLLRKVGKALAEAFFDLLPKVMGGIHGQYTYVPSNSTLTFANGSRIIIGHFQKESDIDAYLGLEYDVIGVEEATTLTAQKYVDIRTCCRSSKPNWRPRTYSTTNPGNIGHAWYKERFITNRDADRVFIPATADDNAFNNPEYRAILDSLTGWRLRAWRYGDWDIAAGQFFTNFRRELHVIKPFVIPDDWTVWGAMDYGFHHYTMAYLLAEDGDGNIYHVAEHGERGWLIPDNAASINAMFERHGVTANRLKTFVAGTDVFAKKEDGITIADKYRAHSIVLKPATTNRINGAAEYLARLGNPDAGRAPRMFMFDTCTRLINCIPSLQVDPNRPEDVRKVNVDDDGRGGDDPYDASRYGIMAATTANLMWSFG
ncbi:terminase large subunit domain-containing protein [Herpetosiphon geysericola]|uniref:terminase large subunit domain-containing protein n=1 Tax=Herpetosiphon geysericola TaxID=70996 RepID=UPI001364C825|nr:terminase family protein [Herpetosiphon geysericola]